MRNMSFAMTEQQIRDGSKTVTRRLGWTFLRPGDLVRAVNKSMGPKKGEKPRRLATLRIVSVRRERLDAITPEDVAREGYPGETCAFFVEKFCRAMKCTEDTEVTRIEFRRWHFDEESVEAFAASLHKAMQPVVEEAVKALAPLAQELRRLGVPDGR